MTHVLVGLCLSACDAHSGAAPIRASDDLSEVLRESESGGGVPLFYARGRTEYERLTVTYTAPATGRPTRLSGVNYTSAYLSRLADHVDDASGDGDRNEPTLESTSVGMDLVQALTEADVTVALIDSQADWSERKSTRFAGLEETVRAAESTTGETLPVATKTDHFRRAFEREAGTTPDERYGQFREFVHERLSRFPEYRDLVSESPYEACFPVYFDFETYPTLPYHPLDVGPTPDRLGFGRVLRELER